MQAKLVGKAKEAFEVLGELLGHGAHGVLDLCKAFEVRGARGTDGVRSARRKLYDGARAGGGIGKLYSLDSEQTPLCCSSDKVSS